MKVENPKWIQAETFAKFFSEKVIKITNSINLSPEVYNGKNKVACDPNFFMSGNDIAECLKSIKIKNCE